MVLVLLSLSTLRFNSQWISSKLGHLYYWAGDVKTENIHFIFHRAQLVYYQTYFHKMALFNFKSFQIVKGPTCWLAWERNRAEECVFKFTTCLRNDLRLFFGTQISENIHLARATAAFFKLLPLNAVRLRAFFAKLCNCLFRFNVSFTCPIFGTCRCTKLDGLTNVVTSPQFLTIEMEVVVHCSFSDRYFNFNSYSYLHRVLLRSTSGVTRISYS
jgi:hypothetical protein